MSRRHLPLATSHNIRDVGGYATEDGRRVRWRTLLRGDAPHRLTAEAQAELVALGLRTVVDLRWAGELRLAPNVFAGSERVDYRHLPIFDDPTERAPLPPTLPETYRLMVDQRGEPLRGALAALAAPGALPALVHCTAGKDRTGVVVALALSIAGVSTETIVADYELSNQYLSGGFYDEVRERVEARGERWERIKPLLHCAPEYMRQTLDHLTERHGSIEGYLRTIGLSPAEIAALRAALTEPAGAEAEA